MEDRGKQAWGWTDGVDIVKNTGRFREGFNTSMLGTPSAMIHTRTGTTGDTKDPNNAHPFNIKGIIGLHNGMIYNHRAMAEKHGIQYSVDSELIFHYIADGLPMEELEGYGTISFYRDGHIYLGRFSTRGDLCLAMTDDGWLWASEKAAVVNAAGIASLGIKFFVDAKLGVLYELNGEKIHKTKQSMKLSDSKPYAAKTNWQDFQGDDWHGPSYSYGAMYGGSRWSDDLFRRSLPLPTAETTTFTAEPSSDADEVVDVSDEFAVDDDDDIPDLFDLTNWYETQAVAHFAFKREQVCADCMEELDNFELIHVNRIDNSAVCEGCYQRNYAACDISEMDYEYELAGGRFTDSFREDTEFGYGQFIN